MDHDDEVDSTSQALMRLINITVRREDEKAREKRLREQQEYENMLEDMGANNSVTDFINAYTGW